MNTKSGSVPNGPDHPNVKALKESWPQIASILMHKLGVKEVIIGKVELDQLAKDSSQGYTFVIQELSDGLHLRYLSKGEAERQLKLHLN